MITSAFSPARRGGAAARRWPAGAPTGRWLADAAIAGVVTAVQLGGTYAVSLWHHRQAAPGPAGYLLLAVTGMSLIGRRRFPVTVLAVTLAGALAGQTVGAHLSWFALIVAFFSAVAARRRAAAVASLVIGYLVSVWPPWLIGRPGHASAPFALGLLAGLLVLLSVAEVARARTQRALALQRGREEEVRRRASEQRIAIARDLHDVLAHNISVINVQANTALHLMDRQPERAREALTTIHDVSRQALAELRSVLGVLRATADGAPRAPSPGLDRLPELAASARSAGVEVRVAEEGTPGKVPPEVGLAAYRIVQEALTNTARHAGGGRASVQLRYHPDALEVEIDDDGPPASAPHRAGACGPGTAGGSRSGNGITGMSERAQALGGTLDAGPRPGGGFRVAARLPLAGGPQ